MSRLQLAAEDLIAARAVLHSAELGDSEQQESREVGLLSIGMVADGRNEAAAIST